MMRVLYVEDDPLDAEAMRRAVVRLRPDIDIIHCARPDAALQQLRNNGNAFGAVVIDVNLPQMTGFEFIDRMQAGGGLARWPKVIVFTGSEYGFDLAESRRIGADAYVVKTPDLDCFNVLVAKLDEIGNEGKAASV